MADCVGTSPTSQVGAQESHVKVKQTKHVLVPHLGHESFRWA